MIYLSQAAIAARVSSETMLRIFDRESTGAVDVTFLTTCANSAESEAEMRSGASFPGHFNDGGATVDEAVINHMVMMTLYEAVRLNPSAMGSSDGKTLGPYEKAYKLALDFFDRLSCDDRNRLKTSAGGRARPRAANINAVDSTNLPTNPLNRVADKLDPSGF